MTQKINLIHNYLLKDSMLQIGNFYKIRQIPIEKDLLLFNASIKNETKLYILYTYNNKKIDL